MKEDITQVAALNECASVYVGQSFKGKASTDDDTGCVKLVQLPDVRGYAVENTDKLEYANLKGKEPRILLREHDILLTLKGSRLHASIYLPNTYESVTTVNHIAVVRTNNNVSSKYLLWYLNSPAAKQDLERMQAGATIPSISKVRLIQLEVPIIGSHRQQLAGKAYRNWCDQNVVLNDLLKSGENYMHSFCSRLVKG